MRTLGPLLLTTLIMTACGITGEQRQERNDVRDLSAQYEKRYIVVSSKPVSKLFDDVNLTCKVEANTYADKRMSEDRKMFLKEIEGQDAFGKSTLTNVNNAGLNMRRPQYEKDGYKNCMNKSGWDIRNVCVKNCSASDRALYQKKRAEYKALYE